MGYIVACAPTDDIKRFPCGSRAVRAAAFPGPARASLNEVADSMSPTGTCLEDTQSVAWTGSGGTFSRTVEIPLAQLGLTVGQTYRVYISHRWLGEPLHPEENLGFWYAPSNAARMDVGWDATVHNQHEARYREQHYLLNYDSIDTITYIAEYTTFWVSAATNSTNGGTLVPRIEEVIFVPYQYDEWYDFDPPAAEETITDTGFPGVLSVDWEQLYPREYQDGASIGAVEKSGDYYANVNTGLTRPATKLWCVAGVNHAPAALVSNDQFSRVVAHPSWGSTPEGYPWTRYMYELDSGGPSQHMVDGNVARAIGLHSPRWIGGGVQYSGSMRQELDDNALSENTDWDMRVKTALNRWPTGDTGDGVQPYVDLELGLVARIVVNPPDAGRAYASIGLTVEADGSLTGSFTFSWIFGTGIDGSGNPYPVDTFNGRTRIADRKPLETPVDLGTYSPGEWWWLRFVRRGYKLYGKVWRDGDAEPDDWTFDSELPGSWRRFTSSPYLLWRDYPYYLGTPPAGYGGYKTGWERSIRTPYVAATVNHRAVRDYLGGEFNPDYWGPYLPYDESPTLDAAFDDFSLRYEPIGDTPVETFFALYDGAEQICAPLNLGKAQRVIYVGTTNKPDGYSYDVYLWNNTGAPALQSALFAHNWSVSYQVPDDLYFSTVFEPGTDAAASGTGVDALVFNDVSFDRA